MIDCCVFSGYNVSDWISDVESKIKIMNVKIEKTKLKDMEFKLEKLLSDEKKTELEIAEIANSLK